MMRPFPLALAAVAVAGAALLPGCSRSTAPGPAVERRPGVLAHYGDPVRVTLPERAAVGEPVRVVVTTYGGGCIAQGETEAAVVGLAADVTPYDYVAVRLPPHGACTMELRLYVHEATLTFAAAGRATVRVHGREVPGGRPLTVAREIVVE